uniref:Uncharacterized protein n=1 Tax=Kalanchoe fedtschenkoi TaxID=63787 RepID=A0A7N0SZD3_KALFE
MFAKSKPVLNRLPLRASAGLAIPPTSVKFTDQPPLSAAAVSPKQQVSHMIDFSEIQSDPQIPPTNPSPPQPSTPD